MSKHNGKSERELLVHIADVLDDIYKELKKPKKQISKKPIQKKITQPPIKKDVNTKTVRPSTDNKETLFDS